MDFSRLASPTPGPNDIILFPHVSSESQSENDLSNATSQVEIVLAPKPTIVSSSSHTMVARAQVGTRKPNPKYALEATLTE